MSKYFSIFIPELKYFTACVSQPCNSGGHCYHDNNEFFCHCPSTYTGKTCDTGKNYNVYFVLTKCLIKNASWSLFEHTLFGFN
jgi:hypothetical protein